MLMKIVRWIWEDRISIVLGTALAMLVITYVLSLEMPFDVEERTVQPVITHPGGVVDVCRGVMYKMPTDITIHRELTQWDSELKLRRSKPLITPTTGKLPREEGALNICRDVVIPMNTTPGKWVIRTYATVETDPFWVRTFEILPLPVEVLSWEDYNGR